MSGAGGQRDQPASHRLAVEDSVMEPRILEVLKECLVGGEEPRVLLEHLSDNYRGFAQMVNLLCDWHSLLGDDDKSLEREVRGHLKAVILRDFDVSPQIDEDFSQIPHETPPKASLLHMVSSQPRRIMHADSVQFDACSPRSQTPSSGRPSLRHAGLTRWSRILSGATSFTSCRRSTLPAL